MPDAIPPYLFAGGIRLSLNHRVILSDIRLQCHEHRVTGLLGRNGSGKSCLFQIIYGLLPAEKSVQLNGHIVYDAYKHPHLVTSLPQFHFIPPSATIRTVFKNFGLDPAAFTALFPELRAGNNTAIGKLSTGERRLVETYVIIKSPSRFSLLDEPFSGLSPVQVEKLMQLIRTETQNKGFLITDHHYRQVMAISDDVYVLKNAKTYFVTADEDLDLLGYTPGTRT
ncbi:ATP-binding cassette domain-containing protein [Niabella drilacis]|uniref:ABC-type multidrug transport system, ATPase component n=1 Tax=Niabella drilacis (strain DSM 25811 / CCM 8410 / CCUG 62505 / LMG 26954 / E90) TaxID=1285928 RepID=A0A1G7BL10_NIADE|nr:ATP-binding cassette domain-containing protein [Niabella drilacis]SDE27791.1 ABC-type multidrug transport system, ATPase component [Niabella drilacis]